MCSVGRRSRRVGGLGSARGRGRLPGRRGGPLIGRRRSCVGSLVSSRRGLITTAVAIVTLVGETPSGVEDTKVEGCEIREETLRKIKATIGRAARTLWNDIQWLVTAVKWSTMIYLVHDCSLCGFAVVSDFYGPEAVGTRVAAAVHLPKRLNVNVFPYEKD